jgi:hypothetical protein
MAFSDCLTSCMSPLPAPTVEGAEDVADFLHQLHSAWENSGGESEMLVSGLVAAGAVTGIDEAALATAGALTVGVYIAALTACLTTCLASSVWDLISAPITPSWLAAQLTAQAETQGIPQPEATA